METQDALEIARSLAKGINPITGECFSDDCPYNHPDIIRALYHLMGLIPTQKKTPDERRKENLLQGLPRNTGLRWTEKERAEVVQFYKAGTPIDSLASSHERSRNAIIAELKRQNIITDAEAASLGLVLRNQSSSRFDYRNTAG